MYCPQKHRPGLGSGRAGFLGDECCQYSLPYLKPLQPDFTSASTLCQVGQIWPSICMADRGFPTEKWHLDRSSGLTCWFLVTRSYTGQIQILEAWCLGRKKRACGMLKKRQCLLTSLLLSGQQPFPICCSAKTEENFMSGQESKL